MNPLSEKERSSVNAVVIGALQETLPIGYAVRTKWQRSYDQPPGLVTITVTERDPEPVKLGGYTRGYLGMFFRYFTLG